MPIAKISGLNISYKVEGEGEPLVMIQGLGSGKGGWLFQVPAFKKHYQVITFDNRGVGESDKPEGPYSMKGMATDTVGLMEYLGIKKAHILGISMGGMIAQEVAINYPEKVLKLILGCTCACHDETSGLTPEFLKAINEQTNHHKPADPKLGANTWFYRIVFYILMSLQSRSLKGEALSGFKAQKEASEKHNTVDRLSSIKAKTLVIAGTCDKAVWPASSSLIAQKIPSSKLIMVKDGSHLFSVEKRSIFNREVLGFLRNG